RRASHDRRPPDPRHAHRSRRRPPALRTVVRPPARQGHPPAVGRRATAGPPRRADPARPRRTVHPAMSRYRKKPVEIEARQLTADNATRIALWCGGYCWYGPGQKLLAGEVTGGKRPNLERDLLPNRRE